MLLLGRDDGDPLFLQIKEAQPSVLEPLLGRSPFATHGQRVAVGQRVVQAASDIFLGWVHADEELDGGAHDFYLRQLWDWKTSVDVETILPRGLTAYATACGWTLARAHARSGDRIAIAAYLGASDRFDRAVAEFAAWYADLNERDHRDVAEAVAEGRVDAVDGVQGTWTCDWDALGSASRRPRCRCRSSAPQRPAVARRNPRGCPANASRHADRCGRTAQRRLRGAGAFVRCLERG